MWSYKDFWYRKNCKRDKKRSWNRAVDKLCRSGDFGPHEEINVNKIHNMVALNLEAPLILTQLFLRDLKKIRGTIINISSITAKKSSTYGCAY